MDVLSLLGICIAFAAILTGNFLDGGDIGHLLNPSAALVVFGGTIGAIVLQTPMAVLGRGIRILVWVFFPPRLSAEAQLKKIIGLSKTARRDGILGLEDLASREPDQILRRGLRLIADGYEPERIRIRLEEEIEQAERRDVRAASIFEHMGGYAPTIGIIGAVMGLIQVMGNLDEPDLVGAGIATAFVATIYGVGFANLLLLPIAGKLREVLRDIIATQVLTMEGIVAIAEGEHPRVIESRLRIIAGLKK